MGAAAQKHTKSDYGISQSLGNFPNFGKFPKLWEMWEIIKVQHTLR
jgi:hypothetical protein